MLLADASQAIFPALGDPAITWVVGGLVLLTLEVAIPGFVVGSFGAAALLTAIPTALGATIPWQIALFALLGVALVIPARKFLLKSTPGLASGIERMVGRQVRCVEAIDGDQTTGVVLVDGARWSASTEPGQAIEAGAQVVITAVEGARVRVRPAATQPR